MVFSGWRLVVAVLLAVVVLTLLIAAALWAAIALVVLGLVVWLNLVLLPRLSVHLHLPRPALDLICLALLAASGWLLNGPTGLGLGALAWLAGIAGPRLAAHRLAARSTAAGRPTIIVVDRPSFGDGRDPGNTGCQFLTTIRPDTATTLQRFVVQLHDATALHFDLRLQVGDLMRSWAVPRGPSLDPAVRRLAVQVSDHSLASGEFEGVHGAQLRGSGAVIIWDEGTVQFLRYEPDHLSFLLLGHKLVGRFGLTPTSGRRWILVKSHDVGAQRGSNVVSEQPTSVRSGKTWQQIAGTG